MSRRTTPTKIDNADGETSEKRALFAAARRPALHPDSRAVHPGFIPAPAKLCEPFAQP